MPVSALLKRPPEVLLAEVKLTRARGAGKEDATFLFLEGPRDIRVLEKFTDSGCKIVAANGKQIAKRTIRLANESGLRGVAALIDRDFDGLLDKASEEPGLFYTDEVDMEMTIVCSNALHRLVIEHLGLEGEADVCAKAGATSFRCLLFVSAAKIGLLHFLNQKNAWNLRLRSLDVYEFVRPSDLEVDWGRMIELAASASGATQVDPATVAREYEEHVDSCTEEPRQYCRGHDVSALLALGLRHGGWSNAPEPITADQIEQHLRLAFHRDDFLSTQFCASMLTWQSENAPYQLLDGSFS